MSADTTEGGCICGAVRYRLAGVPANSMVCHCRTCRRVAGAPVVAWITVPLTDFEIVRGRPAEFQSSEPVRRTFCNACGTPLTYQRRDASGTIDITTCSLDDPNLFPPTHHSWLRHDLAWLRFGDGLPAFDEWRNDAAAVAKPAPFHAHIYYDLRDRVAAERLHQQFSRAKGTGDLAHVVFVGEMRDRNVGPHPKPQFELHFLEDALPGVLPLIKASGLTAIIHPLTDDDLADHTSLARWIGEPLPLDHSVLDPPGKNQGIARFGKSDV